jgi:3-oxoacyl-[acyl-carrier-protein] synthase-3
MHYAHIAGTGSSIPERILTNQDLERIVDTSNEWIIRRTGISERHIARIDHAESTADLGSRAARSAMAMAGITAEQIDSIIVATVSADRQFPSAACMVQKELEAFNAAAYDISAGCSGFIYGLELANNAIRCDMAKVVLVIGAERLSSLVNWKDRGTCVLLGDGAGAAILEARPEPGGILSTHIKSDGRYWDLLYAEEGNDYLPDSLQDVAQVPFHLKMEGNRLFRQAVGCMAAIAETAMARNQIGREQIRMLIPHQANYRILHAVAEKIQVPTEKVFTNLQKYGNTSSASIPIALDEANREGHLAPGDHILMLSFGAGLTWGASILKWSMQAGR